MARMMTPARRRVAWLDSLAMLAVLVIVLDVVRVRADGPVRSSNAATPAPAPSAAAPPAVVVALYRAHCIDCHDTDGRGEAGRALHRTIPDFTDARWQASVRDADLVHTVTNGKGKGMPAMKRHLRPADVTALVSLVRGFRGGAQVIADDDATDTQPSPPAAPRPSTRTPAKTVTSNRTSPATAELFQRTCRACHGADGRGNAGRLTMPAIPDFSSAAWHARHSRSELMASILVGKGRLMPAFRGRISAEQARQLADFVRAFGPAQAAPAESSVRDFDQRFSQLQRELETLRREYDAVSRGSADAKRSEE